MSQALNGLMGTNHAFANLADSGEVLPAPGANKRYRIYGVVISVNTATTAHFRSAATPISGNWYLPATGGIVLSDIKLSWFKTAANEALNLNLSAPTACSVMVIYDII